MRPELFRQLKNQLQESLQQELETILYRPVRLPLEQHLEKHVYSLLNKSWHPGLKTHLDQCIRPEYWASWASLFDYSISVLNCPQTHRRKWAVFQEIVKNCGWIFSYEKVCAVVVRPLQLSFDNTYRLHAEGQPALRYPDGFSVYCYRGVFLPEKYGRLHPHQWQAQWLLTEKNLEVRRALIQGIGYGRISQELESTRLNSWHQYTLLSINPPIDVQPVHLLKMTCPSTQLIHVLRVPPNLYSAREAIRWTNWGIEPFEFAIQT